MDEPAKESRMPSRKHKARKNGAFEQLTRLLAARFNSFRGVTEDHLLSVLSVLAARATLFGEGLFSDPAWEILLQLYAAELGHRTISVAELARSVDAPESVTERWLSELYNRGIVVVRVDPVERDSVVSMTSEALVKMNQLAEHWIPAFYSI